MDIMQREHVVNSSTLESYGDLLTVKDLSVFLGISSQTIYKEIKQGKFGKPLKFGREYRIPKIYIVQRYMEGYGSSNQEQLK